MTCRATSGMEGRAMIPLGLLVLIVLGVILDDGAPF
jgi:hypothetical protein